MASDDPRSARSARRDARAEAAAAFLGEFRFPERSAPPDSVVAHLGPTNSGKSHDALALLAEVGAGVYAAPLRLLAREGFDKLRAALPEGKVGLLTGEERINPGADVVCCTTELAPLRGRVLVLDEVHWADDRDRGWAWGRLLAAASYRHIRLVGATNVEPLLRAAYGDQLEVRQHRRLVPLTWGGTVELATVPTGSLVVAFSRKAVLALGRDVADRSGLRTGVLYGALPPGARRHEIERFLVGELDVLCVTDVIGHGINLPARTVVMAETSKYDGQRRRPLHLWELAQIVGRAGRYGLAESGDARVLRGVPGLDANASLVRQAVEAADGSRAAGASLRTAYVRPTLADLGATTGAELRAVIEWWQDQAAEALSGHPWLRAGPLDHVADALAALARAGLLAQLGVDELWRLATLPVEDPAWIVEVAQAVAEPHRQLRPAPRPDPAGWSLEDAERVAARSRGLASLANAFPGVGGLDRDDLLATEEAAAKRITSVLAHEVASNRFGTCSSCGRPCPPYAVTCQRCSGHQRLPRPKRGGRGPGRRR
ncbi:MAG: helicase-related protein [Acidimicrobiia bacterium]|nr:helicase-related protein [Acidimicrobiia bacterium]